MEGVPQVVANCKILSKLGQGGMGSVYRSVHLTLGRNIAIKILPAEFTRSPEYVSRFLREARAIANLNHPNIVLVHDAGEQSGLYYIAMELVDGASLAIITRHCSKLPEIAALDFLQQAAKGLGYAHDRGLVHRDIKPENLLVNREGTLKVVDFGLVLEASSQSHLTRTGTFLGTPTFMSPEQCDGEVADARSDLYSLGATFYCILTGRAPFTATSALGIMYKHKFEAPPPLDPDTSQDTTNIIFKLLAKKREERYQTAKELAADVTRVLRQIPENPEWSLDRVLSTVAPPAREPSAAEMAAARGGPETITLRGAAGGPSAGPPRSEFPSAGVVKGSSSAAFEPTHTPSAPGMAWDPTVITNRTPPPPGSTPAPAPLPGTATPAPGRQRGRPGLWLGLAAVVLIGFTGGGFLLWRQNREATLEQHLKTIESLRQAGQLDDANLRLHLALTGFPDEPRLASLRSQLSTEIANQRKEELDKTRLEVRKEVRKEVQLEDLTVKAEAAVARKKFDEALRIFDDALKLNMDADNIQARIREVRYEKLTNLVSAAEAAGKWDDALALAQQALEFGSAEELVHRLQQRVKLEGLRKEAGALLDKKDLLAAADKYEAASAFALDDEALKKDLLATALKYRLKYHLSLADEAEQKRAWNSAISALTSALALTPEDPALQKRLADARTTLRNETSYESAMDMGKKAMDAKHWGEAAELYRAALRHKEDSTEAQALLTEAGNREQLDQLAALTQSKAWNRAKALLDENRKALDAAPQADLKDSYATLSTSIQNSLDEIGRREALARRATDEGPLENAVSEYQALVELNPAERAKYESALTSLRIEQAFRDRLTEGDTLTQAGQYLKARTSYRQALEKRNDAKAQAIVQQRIDLLSGMEKLGKIDPLLTEKNWTEAQTQLQELQKSTPAESKELTKLLADRLTTVNEALSRIDTLEKTGASAATQRTWDEGRQALKQLMDLNPSKKQTYQKQLDELEAAFKAFNDQAARQARYDQAMADAQKRLDQGDEAGALTAGQEALNSKPDDAAAKTLVAEAQKRQATKAAEKALTETHQRVTGFLDNSRLDDALKAAQDAARAHPTVPAFGTMSSALTEMQNARSKLASSSLALDQGVKLLQQAPSDVQSLTKNLDALKQQLSEQDASAAKSFSARDYQAAQTAARALAGDALSQTSGLLERTAAQVDQQGEKAASGSGTRRFRQVGEIGVEDNQRKPDPQKAAKYRESAKALRDLAAGLKK